MKDLSRQEYKQLLNFLMPYLREMEQRKSIVTAAYFQTPILDRLNLNQQGRAFTVSLIDQTLKFGEVESGIPALWLIFEEIYDTVGIDVQNEIDDIKAIIFGEDGGTDTELVVSNEIATNTDIYVFISYARPDEAIASQIEAYLQSAGIKVFRDATSIRPGDNWDLTIEQALEQATMMVLLESTHSMPTRKEVYREWIEFEQKGKPIIPLYLEECELPSRLKLINYINARGDINSALKQMLQRILDVPSKNRLKAE